MIILAQERSKNMGATFKARGGKLAGVRGSGADLGLEKNSQAERLGHGHRLISASCRKFGVCQHCVCYVFSSFLFRCNACCSADLVKNLSFIFIYNPPVTGGWSRRNTDTGGTSYRW